jgi:hypothetical protein
MSLEMEAERQRAGPPPEERSGLKLSPGWEILFRLVALLVLAAAAFAVLWVPVALLAPPAGLVGVLAILTIALVAMAGRLHELRIRVDALEDRSGDAPEEDAADEVSSPAPAGDEERPGEGGQD